MAYDYATERPKVFTEDGVSMLLKIRDTTKALIAKAGVARCDKMMNGCSIGTIQYYLKYRKRRGHEPQSREYQ